MGRGFAPFMAAQRLLNSLEPDAGPAGNTLQQIRSERGATDVNCVAGFDMQPLAVRLLPALPVVELED